MEIVNTEIHKAQVAERKRLRLNLPRTITLVIAIVFGFIFWWRVGAWIFGLLARHP